MNSVVRAQVASGLGMGGQALRSSVYGMNRQMSFKPGPKLGKPMSASYVDMMYSQWRADPNSVDPAWQEHFANSGQSAATPSSS